MIVAHALLTNPRTTADRLTEYIAQGGNVVMLWDSLADLAGNSVANVSIPLRPDGSVGSHAGGDSGDGCTRYLAGTLKVTFASSPSAAVVEPLPTIVCPLAVPPGAEVLATAEVINSIGGAGGNAGNASNTPATSTSTPRPVCIPSAASIKADLHHLI